MAYPQFTDFNEALQNPRTAFTDAELQNAQADTNPLGLPVALGGGFAYTYPMTTPRRKVAVRCFHRQVPSAEQRYDAISKKLGTLASPYFVNFDYQPKGIKIHGAGYPIVRMEWVNGDTLGVFLERRAKNAKTIDSLRAQFRAMALILQRAGIAHGDIQNLNVIVVGTELRLIDYDGMYVPPMQTGGGEEVGHKHWQHPQRSQRDFGPNMDRFSFIVVDVSLRAIIADPALHGRFNEGGETIIFKANDYADPSSSETFRILRAKPELQSAVHNLERICSAPISRVPTLEEFLAGNNIPGTSVRAAPAPAGIQGKPKQAAYISAYPVVDAADFSKAVKNVGNRVELVGRITDFKYDIGRRGRGRGKPYVFLNFGHWKGNIVKLTFWSDGLANMTNKPEQSWVGRWISVTGLIDAPYTSHRYNYTHVGITVAADGQVQFITEADANYRLGRASASTQQDNQDVLRNLGAAVRPATPKGVTSSRGVQPMPPLNPPQTNRDILNAIRRGPSTPAAGPGHSLPTPSMPPKGTGWAWVVGIIRRALIGK
jgi:hypothetical protein